MHKIYLLIGKIVGYQVLKFLIKEKYEINYICVSSIDDTEIIEYCIKNNLKYTIYNQSFFLDLLTEEYEDGWLINAWSPHRIPDSILKKFYRNINLHPSYVPFGKGSDSGTWAIRENTIAGVSLITITNELDEGDIYFQKKVHYDLTTTGEELSIRLKNELISIFCHNWNFIYMGHLNALSQPLGIGTKHKKSETKADKTKKITDFNSVLEFIKWSNSHSFSTNTLPEIIIDSEIFSIDLEIKKLKT